MSSTNNNTNQTSRSSQGVPTPSTRGASGNPALQGAAATPAGYPQGVPAGYPQGAPVGYPQGAGYSQGVPAGYPQGTPAGYPQGAPAGYPQGAYTGYPQGAPVGYPQGAGYTQGTPAGYPQGAQAGYPQGGPTGYARGAPSAATGGTTHTQGTITPLRPRTAEFYLGGSPERAQISPGATSSASGSSGRYTHYDNSTPTASSGPSGTVSPSDFPMPPGIDRVQSDLTGLSSSAGLTKAHHLDRTESVEGRLAPRKLTKRTPRV
ncbi:hypothetical protein C8Q73DRAFT_672186 [Cubamyces lactineus]|nr:hypothetical protein C8Q73DRAFT_672186 [Cubamyces lactineus]